TVVAGGDSVRGDHLGRADASPGRPQRPAAPPRRERARLVRLEPRQRPRLPLRPGLPRAGAVLPDLARVPHLWDRRLLGADCAGADGDDRRLPAIPPPQAVRTHRGAGRLTASLPQPQLPLLLPLRPRG